MLNQALYYCLLLLCVRGLAVTDTSNTFGSCVSCVQIEECPFVRNMNMREQRVWLEQYSCDKTTFGTTRIYEGFSSVAKGDHICCPRINQLKSENGDLSSNHQTRQIEHARSSNDKIHFIDNNLPKNQENHFSSNNDGYISPNIDRRIRQLNKRISDGPYFLEKSLDPKQVVPNLSTNNRKIRQDSKQTIDANPYFLEKSLDTKQVIPNPLNNNRRIRQVNEETINTNPYFLKKSLYPKQVVPNPLNNKDNRTYLEQQCEVQTSLPPDPETGCCGQDTSDADRITDLERFLPTLAPLVSNKWKQYFLPRQASKQDTQIKESTKNKTDEITFESRIAGGNETELDQFPWTVLLKISFNYGDRVVDYSCGGSLISLRHVLTAAHCLYEEGAQLTGLEITLAEYDKRTFPNDCVAVNGEGRKCIQNIVIPAEDIIIHPLYEVAWLHNDIALIRLRGFAPYTRFIRPICLAPLDIDVPNLTNLPLSVAGWGRSRQFFTNVKQSTVLKLIPHDQCERYYSNLSKDHICAAGDTGEDTCKGDSGGPLMILFRGRYYVMGVVSGKRADSPCGTSVPSLFTNVFNYIDWIQSVVRNY